MSASTLPFEAIFLVIALVGAAVHLLVQKGPRTPARILEILLVWLLVVGIGVSSIFGAMGHLFMPDEVARSIGWPTGSPFQRENAFGDLGVGVLGVLCIWKRGNFWDAAAIMSAILFFGDAYGHVFEWVAHHDTAPNNIGAPLYADIIVPLLVLILLIAYRQLQEPGTEPAEIS